VTGVSRTALDPCRASAYLAFRREPRIGAMVMTGCGDFGKVRDLAIGINDGLVALTSTQVPRVSVVASRRSGRDR
jgi:hypothetical protein